MKEADNSGKIVHSSSTDQPGKNQKLGKVTDYDGTECYSVQPDNHDLAAKSPKRQPNWIRTNIRRLIAGAAAFTAALAPTVEEAVHPTEVTIHGSPATKDRHFRHGRCFSHFVARHWKCHQRSLSGWSTQYLVRWFTYGPKDDTWETEQELRRHANEMVDAYEASNGPIAGINTEPSEQNRHQGSLAVVISTRR